MTAPRSQYHEALSAERVRELLSYDPASGLFRWKFARRGLRAGAIAGTIGKNGYVGLSVDRFRVYAHRLAIFYQTGAWPACQVDHIDGNRTNNAFANLRDATSAENQANRTTYRRGFDRGLPRGVSRGRRPKNGKPWKAVIKVAGKVIHLGSFDDVETAHAAYMNAARQHFGDYARSF